MGGGTKKIDKIIISITMVLPTTQNIWYMKWVIHLKILVI